MSKFYFKETNTHLVHIYTVVEAKSAAEAMDKHGRKDTEFMLQEIGRRTSKDDVPIMVRPSSLPFDIQALETT